MALRNSVRFFSTPAGKKQLTAEQIATGLKNNEKYKNYIVKINSVSPSAIAHDAIALLKEYEEPKNKREIGLLADMPAVHYNRKVIIEPRPQKSTTQGYALSHQWQITWSNESKWSNPLMGWTSGEDPMSSVRLRFDNREEAIGYAKRNGWKFTVRAPTSMVTVEPGTFKYHQNFLPTRVTEQLKIEGMKNKIFVNSNYGKSNWFMPLNYHGTAPCVQHGPSIAK